MALRFRWGLGWLCRRLGLSGHAEVQRRRLPAEFLAYLVNGLIRFLKVTLRLLLNLKPLFFTVGLLATAPAASEHAGRNDNRDADGQPSLHWEDSFAHGGS
jgi:hypothetical protein